MVKENTTLTMTPLSLCVHCALFTQHNDKQWLGIVCDVEMWRCGDVMWRCVWFCAIGCSFFKPLIGPEVT